MAFWKSKKTRQHESEAEEIYGRERYEAYKKKKSQAKVQYGQEQREKKMRAAEERGFKHGYKAPFHEQLYGEFKALGRKGFEYAKGEVKKSASKRGRSLKGSLRKSRGGGIFGGGSERRKVYHRKTKTYAKPRTYKTKKRTRTHRKKRRESSLCVVDLS